mgnify:CR=1 FL=1
MSKLKFSFLVLMSDGIQSRLLPIGHLLIVQAALKKNVSYGR